MRSDLDHVVEHALDAIESRDQVAKSGWVGWVEVTAVFSMMRQVAGVMDCFGIELKQKSTGLARKSTMLAGKMTPIGEAIELQEKP
jgi:hypothetical protein